MRSAITPYNQLAVWKRGGDRGNVSELHGWTKDGAAEGLLSAVDLDDPLRLVLGYTRTLYAALFFCPEPSRALMVGLGAAGFHRMFAAAFPKATLQTVEIDPEVVKIAAEKFGFVAGERTPVAVGDGRAWIQADWGGWDWLILDAFHGVFVPPHLKTVEFYRHCAARVAGGGVFVTNLHPLSGGYFSDLLTLREVFPQIVLFHTGGWANVIACCVKYEDPDMTDPEQWPKTSEIWRTPFHGRLNLDEIRVERIRWPEIPAHAQILRDPPMV
jgi:spermidine synthase